MSAALRRVLALALVLAPFYALASDWQQPTPEELSMTSYAADPDAPAVFLFREETADDNLNVHSFYARVKILSEKGKEMFGDIAIDYVASTFKITNIGGRTIHSDGAVIPFAGKPYDKLLVKSGGVRIMTKVFSMPDVQVGSILEYRYTVRYDTDLAFAPNWRLQQQVPVLKGHYRFVPSSRSTRIAYSSRLRAADKLTQEKNGSFDLTVANIPAYPQGDFLPPFGDLAYRVSFYYSDVRTSDEFWREEGDYWSKSLDRFARPSDKVRAAVNAIITPQDSDEQKVAKIYSAVMKLDNTSFTRQHSAQENKAEHLKIKSAQDIWAQKRGYDDEITWLFLAMVRAAGLKAYGAMVVDRDQNLFDPSYLTWNQLDDALAIVVINGKEDFFDPGQRYCEFGKLHWKHTWAGGIRQTSGGTQIFTSPGPNYLDNRLLRTAQLTLDPDGHVHGVIQETMTGVQALAWRHAALRGDEAETTRDFERELQHSMPSGVQVAATRFSGLADFTHPLTVVASVSGILGTQTGKHMFLPAVFFESGNPPLFAAAQREEPVDMHYPYMIEDQFRLTLPPNLSVDSLPQSGDIPLPQSANYISKFASQAHLFAYGRLLTVARLIYKAADYPQLRGFYQKVSTSDQQQVALTVQQ